MGAGYTLLSIIDQNFVNGLPLWLRSHKGLVLVPGCVSLLKVGMHVLLARRPTTAGIDYFRVECMGLLVKNTNKGEKGEMYKRGRLYQYGEGINYLP